MKSRANVQALVQCAVLTLAAAALAACSGGGPGAAPTTVSALPAAPAAGQASTARTTSSHIGNDSTPNWAGAWMFVDDNAAAYPVLALDATSNSHVTWPIYHRDTAIERTVASSQTIYYGSSLADVTSGAQTTPPPFVFYDIEHWSSTPVSEQQDPVGSIAKAAQIVHAAGKKFGVSPDGIFMGVTRCTFVMSMSIIQQVDWTQVDELNIQAQHLASDNTCTKVGSSSFQSMVQQVASYVKSENPNIIISAQLSMRDSSPTRIIAAANAVYGIANVIKISDPADSYSCVYCTLDNLNTILTAL